MLKTEEECEITLKLPENIKKIIWVLIVTNFINAKFPLRVISGKIHRMRILLTENVGISAEFRALIVLRYGPFYIRDRKKVFTSIV